MKFFGGLLLFLGGMVTGVAALAGGVYIYGANTSVNNALGMIGMDASTLVTNEYGSKNIVDFIKDVSSKEFKTLDDFAELSPIVDTAYDKINSAFSDGLGVSLNKTELYATTFDDMSDYLMTYVKDNLVVANLLNVDENSNQALIYICYEKDESGNFDYDSPRTLSDLSADGYASTLIDDATLQDLVDISESDTVLYALRESKISELESSINTLTFGTLMGIDSSSPKILQAIAGSSISTIADDINDVKISDMYDTSSNSIFESLPEDTTIGNLPDKVTQIKIVDVFSGDIWPDGVDHTEDNAVAIWKYMLIDSTGTFNTSYLLCDDMDQLTDNVTRNVNKASIGDLVNDGFITLSDTSVLSKPDPSGSGKTVGELTFAEFLEAYGSL